jgi:hypothetical protein
MNEHPSPCLICGQHPRLSDDGAFLELVYCYQRIDGKLRLAEDIVLHKPLYWIHAEC